MPCYTPKVSSNQNNEDDFFTQFNIDSTKHVIDYYYTKKYQLPIPKALYQSDIHWAVSSENYFIIQDNVPAIENEFSIILDIAHHISCDEVDFEELYQVIEHLKIYEDPIDGGYARIIKIVADVIRSKFKWTPPYLS